MLDSVDVYLNVGLLGTALHIPKHIVSVLPDGLLKVANLTFERHCPVHREELSFDFLVVDFEEGTGYLSLA